MPTAPEKLSVSVIHSAHSGWLIPAFAFLLASFPCDMILADEPASIIDLNPLAKYIKPNNRQPEPDQSTGHSGTTPSPIDRVGGPGMNGLDVPSSSQKWHEPAKIEEIPSVDGEIPSIDAKKHFLITTPLPVPYCLINEIGSSFRQQKFACENTKF